jgi:hypothetical protein
MTNESIQGSVGLKPCAATASGGTVYCIVSSNYTGGLFAWPGRPGDLKRYLGNREILGHLQASSADEALTHWLNRHKFVSGEWTHLFGKGSKETRCRIVIDVAHSKLLAAQEWTGLKYETLRGERLQDLAESVLGANEAHIHPDDFGLDLHVGSIRPVNPILRSA